MKTLLETIKKHDAKMEAITRDRDWETKKIIYTN